MAFSALGYWDLAGNPQIDKAEFMRVYGACMGCSKLTETTMAKNKDGRG
jgi:hypothetical protein